MVMNNNGKENEENTKILDVKILGIDKYGRLLV